MSELGNIIRKELKELMTPSTFLPIVIMAILFGSLGSTFSGIEEDLGEAPVIASTSFLYTLVTPLPSVAA